jgi:hypothetical protein
MKWAASTGGICRQFDFEAEQDKKTPEESGVFVYESVNSYS